MMKWILLLALSLSAIVGPLHAQSQVIETANDLVAACRLSVAATDGGIAVAGDYDAVKVGNATYCLAYIAGFSDAMSLTSVPLFCSPTNSTMGQARKVFLKYMDEHPEELHLPVRI